MMLVSFCGLARRADEGFKEARFWRGWGIILSLGLTLEQNKKLGKKLACMLIGD